MAKAEIVKDLGQERSTGRWSAECLMAPSVKTVPPLARESQPVLLPRAFATADSRRSCASSTLDGST